MLTYFNVRPGDPSPWFHARTIHNPRFAFDTVGGRYIVLCFLGSVAAPRSRTALGAVLSRSRFFNDETASFFGVSVDPSDETENRLTHRIPGYRFFLDFDKALSRLFGAAPKEPTSVAGVAEMRNLWVVLDPMLRVSAVIPFTEDKSDIPALLAYLDALPPPSRFIGFPVQAPILVLPNVFEPEFCSELIARYERNGGEESGFVREANGKTILVHDHSHKRRKDYLIEDQELIASIQARFVRRVITEIHKAHQFKASRMERYIVSCYAAEDDAHFRAHRDNTTKGTAHRRFAVSVNLNSDFDGGEVSFPEYGPQGFKAPVGGAVVFSCSLLHAVSQVTRGRRFAFLPFLYDDAAAKIRSENNAFLSEEIGQYEAHRERAAG